MKRLAILIAVLAAPAAAETRPVQRPGAAVEVLSETGTVQVAGTTALDASVRPVRRVSAAIRDEREMSALIRSDMPRITVDGSVGISARPDIRPPAPAMPAPPPAAGRAAAPAAQTTQASVAPSDGSGGLCGRAVIRGEVIAPVVGPGGCGIDSPVRVTQVSGLRLTRPARMDCQTAVALDDWVRSGVIPTIGRRGGGAVALEVAGAYSCRTRNNQPGAKMSEHSLGHAIDISGLRLADGSALSVLRDWGRGTEGAMLRALWQAACGPFGTVLGPDSDRYHQDHLHFDTTRYRTGSYCR